MRYRIYDHHRSTHYDVETTSVEDAIRLVQNDQWAEQLDPANVTDAEHLSLTPPDWDRHHAIARAQHREHQRAQAQVDQCLRDQGVF